MTPENTIEFALRSNGAVLPRSARLTLASLTLSVALVGFAHQTAYAQSGRTANASDALARHHPDLYDLVVRVERVRGIAIGELAREGQAVRSRGDSAATAGFETTLVERLSSLLHDGSAAAVPTESADAGLAVLGPRGAEVVRRTQAFQREVLGILADPELGDPRAALAAAVSRYRSRPAVALPSVPKDMDILYGHPYAQALRTSYAELDGLLWAGNWLRLATTEPLTDLPPGPEREAGIDTVTHRFRGKLMRGEPPQHVPTEIPLAPAIAPGLIWLSPASAMIWDNLSMLLEVVGDVLASHRTADVQASIEAALDFFLDAEAAVTDRDEWEIMALRHGIFFQGGFPLAVMTRNERNTGGHSAHGGARVLMTIPGMPIRR